MSINRRLFKTILIFFFFVVQRNIFPQISPGDLTTAHADLEGLSNCTKCHVLGKQVYNSKCLDCHKEIVELINLGRGYHSSSEVKNKDCWSCHSEHHGRNFRIINFNPKGFDHNKTGFALTGSHLKLECSSCHTNKFITKDDFKKRPETYLGLEKNCVSCHKDFHQGTLGNNCSGCHNTEKFKPAAGFNHDKTDFKLIGSHKVVECVKCHPMEERNGEKFQEFKGVSFSSCTPCHKDVHQGKFGINCQSCHNENSFHQINKSSFDHSKTNFPLLGKHAFVKCDDCHKTSISTKLKYEKCYDCHADYHKGDFTENGVLKDCSSCHNENGFTPVHYSIEDHNKTEFKLTGSHLAVPCGSCHYKNDTWHFKNIGTKCIDCHNNVHGQEISAKFMGNNNCSGCHSSRSWSAISFEHDKTNFPLLGKHVEVSCRSCHYKKNNNEVSGEFKFVSLDSKCLACHNDYHHGQFNDSECEKCHTFDNWKPTKFDHNKSKFSLEGAHSKIECSRCHKVVNENNVSFVRYKIENFKCASCHS